MEKKQGIHIPIAIIGMGCIFAKSENSQAFLHLLMRGIDGISDPPATHQHLGHYLDPDPKKPDHIYCNRGGFIPLVDFDPTEFGIPPHVLEATDTSQLLGLLTARRALEDAGYGPNAKDFDRSKTSVILGVTGTQELVIPLGARLGHPFWRKALEQSGVGKEQSEAVIERISDAYVGWQENSFPGLLGNVVAGRIANRLDLGGTNCVVDAACASSMGAIHMAILELTTGSSNMVITGGVDTINDAFMHMCFSKTQILSSSGDIRPFSEHADGTVLGEGIGLIVLKRLADALRDKDRIYAVIKAIGSASDGKSQSIYAPRPEGQARSLMRAYAQAGIDPASVELAEAHGTGTRVGDQVEFRSLCDVFGGSPVNGNRCALGSVKSNIGHTKAAAGTAGLIKAALSIYHKMLPPTLKADPVDPRLHIEKSPFYLNTTLRPWIKKDNQPRRAGVSAFGFGGSNFHLLLEEHEPRKSEPSWDGSVEVIAFSGKSVSDLSGQVKTWLDQLSSLSQNHRAELARLCRNSRLKFNTDAPIRMVIVLDDLKKKDSVESRLRTAVNLLNGSIKPDPRNQGIFIGRGDRPGELAFIFPGQGSQYVGMGRDLICCFPGSLDEFQDAETRFQLDDSLSELVFPRMHAGNPEKESNLKRTDHAQPAIGAVSVAMLEALAYFGITAQATCGHSYGELVALHAANWISRKDLWKLSAARGRLMADAGKTGEDPGSMLAVQAPLAELEKSIETFDGRIVLANRNSPQQGVLSGASADIEQAEELCRQKGWKTVWLPVAAAFHSPLVAAARKPFSQIVADTPITPGSIRVMSNTSGSVYPQQADPAKKLLKNQLIRPVDFVANIESLYAQGVRTFVEVGPKNILTRLISTTLSDRPHHALAVDRSAGRRFGLIDLAETLAQLAASGYPVHLDRWEKPLPDERKPRMVIPICGANYRRPQDKTHETPVTEPVPSEPHVHENNRLNRTDPGEPAIKGAAQSPLASVVDHSKIQSLDPPPRANRQGISTRLNEHPKRETMNSNQKEQLRTALAAVQQGMSSLQAMQAQTAQAHQKFLETQAEASRTLQQMMRSAQQLAASGPGGQPSMPLAVEMPRYESVQQTEPITAPVTGFSNTAAFESGRPEPQPAAAPLDTDYQTQDTRLAAVAETIKPLEQELLQIVSHLTGYPKEMLGLEMDIEADLGIDSIKRVEILSALEEQLPGLPKITPDMMGTLKTLGQIAAYLNDGSQPTALVQVNEKIRQAPCPACTPAPDAPSETFDPESIGQTLQQIVSDLTGYPKDMLGLEMDIEADLGIDSIKRVEILSALEEKMPLLPKITPDMMGTLKTLGQITDFLSRGTATPSNQLQAPPPSSAPGTLNSFDNEPHAVERYKVEPIPAGSAVPPVQASMCSGCFIGIVPDDRGVADALAAHLQSIQLPVEILRDPQAARPNDRLAGLVVFAPIQPRDAFCWAKACAPALKNSADNGFAFFTTVSRLDGCFGFSGTALKDPVQGSLAGLAKTAAREWPAVRCTAIDIDADWQDPVAIAQAIASELFQEDDRPFREIGLGPDQRVFLEMVPARIHETNPIRLEKQDVVLITGGARGVTAAAALALARHAPCNLALLGRSPVPEHEPQWLLGLHEEAAIKKAILEHTHKDSASPRFIEEQYTRWMNNRRINQTLESLTEAKVAARYFSLDVRDAAAVDKTIRTIRQDLGPVKALIHGAGVLADRLIVDKDVAQFDRVFETKVTGLQNLLAATRDDDLKYIVLFSSVSGRLGNSGQADYAMANEALNKIACQQARMRPDCKVTSINWGPWDGGMVTPSLKRSFVNQGIALIPVDQGTAMMIAEMASAKSEPVEVVIGSMLPAQIPEYRQKPTEPQENQHASIIPPPLSLAAKREIDVDRYPVLQSHTLNGRPVVPLALIAEWLAHSALHANPGLTLHGIDQLRLLSGIALDQKKKMIRLFSGKAKRNGGHYEVDVQIRDGKNGNREIVHSSAKAILTDLLPEPPEFKENGHFKAGAYKRTIEEIYGQILFHGQELRGIQKIIRLSDKGMTARLASAPAPESWIQEPLRSRWISDPLVLDCAFQMAIVWCFEQTGTLSLPSYAETYRQYRDRFPADGVTAVMEVHKTTDRKMVADFTFLDDQKRIVACLNGYEAIMDEGLLRAFRAA